MENFKFVGVNLLDNWGVAQQHLDVIFDPLAPIVRPMVDQNGLIPFIKKEIEEAKEKEQKTEDWRTNVNPLANGQSTSGIMPKQKVDKVAFKEVPVKGDAVVEGTWPLSVEMDVESNKGKDYNQLEGGDQKVLFCNMKKEKSKICTVCGRGFTKLSELNRHVIGVHLKDSPERPVCVYCNKSFSRKAHLLQHIFSFHEGQRYSCDICKKSFSQKRNLQLHAISVHESKGGYPCDMCERSFARKSHLQQHVLTVHEGRRYPCDLCRRNFSRPYHLQQHILSFHEGQRYTCLTCKKNFCQKRNLQLHVQTIHENQGYPCDVCKKLFPQRRNLERHVLSVHDGRR